MILSADDFRRHVPWSATGIWRIVDSVCTGDSQISYSDVSSSIENQILRLDVSVNYVASMHMFKAKNNTRNEKFYFEL